MNLIFHEEDFALSAEWNFFASSHGKNACDSAGWTIKTEATRKTTVIFWPYACTPDTGPLKHDNYLTFKTTFPAFTALLSVVSCT